jgi:hypothetical protein
MVHQGGIDQYDRERQEEARPHYLGFGSVDLFRGQIEPIRKLLANFKI